MDKKRLLIDRPYIGAIVMTFVLFIGISFVGTIPGLFVSIFMNGDEAMANQIGVIVITIVVLLVYRAWLRRERFPGVLSFAKVAGTGVQEACRLVALVFVVDVICFTVISFVDYGGIGNLVLPTVSTFVISLCAGIFEETAFRAIPLSILMKNRPTTKRVILAVIISSFIFGIVHMSNMALGVSLAISLYQSWQAMVIGAMFAVIYLRTGSIILPMAFHFMHDLVNTMLPDQSTGLMLQQSIRIGTLIPDLVLMTCEIVVTIYLLRPGKIEDIKEVWREKWSEGVD